MIIALCVKGKDLTSELDVRFGRAENFLFFDSESGEFSVVENRSKNASGGAGSSAVQQLIDGNAEIVIAPEVGPSALDALNKFEIPAFKQGNAATVMEAVEAWKAGTLEKVEKAGVKGLHKA